MPLAHVPVILMRKSTNQDKSKTIKNLRVNKRVQVQFSKSVTQQLIKKIILQTAEQHRQFEIDFELRP